jgi:hypothetical protein
MAGKTGFDEAQVVFDGLVHGVSYGWKEVRNTPEPLNP